jgi:hypothetical protein
MTCTDASPRVDVHLVYIGPNSVPLAKNRLRFQGHARLVSRVKEICVELSVARKAPRHFPAGN